MNRFKDKIVLVTGGTQGMGYITAEAFAKEGAVVYISGRDEQKGRNAAKKIGEYGNAHFVQCDIGNKESVNAMINTIVISYGRLDCAFNNAGITSEKVPIAQTSPDDWEAVINTNINGTYYCMKYEMEQMLKNDGGVILNNASIAGVVPIPRQAAYVTSKTAIIGLTKAASIDYALEFANPDIKEKPPIIRVNVIACGPVLGGMNTKEKLEADPESTARKYAFNAFFRFAKPEEVAQTVLFLCSNEASYINGIVVPIDGGMQAGKWR